jgi:hypothetical protein
MVLNCKGDENLVGREERRPTSRNRFIIGFIEKKVLARTT